MNGSVLLVGNFLSGSGRAPGVCEALAGRLSRRGLVRRDDIAGARPRPPSPRHSPHHPLATARLRGRSRGGVQRPCVSLGRAGVLGATSTGKPYCLTLHGGNLPAFGRRWPRRVRAMVCAADVVTSPSGFLREELGDFATTSCSCRILSKSSDTPSVFGTPRGRGSSGCAAFTRSTIPRSRRASWPRFATTFRTSLSGWSVPTKATDRWRAQGRGRADGSAGSRGVRRPRREGGRAVGPVRKRRVPEHHPGGQRAGQRRGGDGVRALRRQHLRGRHSLSDRARPQRSPRAAWRCGRDGGRSPAAPQGSGVGGPRVEGGRRIAGKSDWSYVLACWEAILGRLSDTEFRFLCPMRSEIAR